MRVQVKLFATAREIAGSGEVAVEVPRGAAIEDVERSLLAIVPGLVRVLPHARWAVDREFAAPGAVLDEASEVALIPPVSGG